MSIYKYSLHTPLGDMLAAAADQGICFLEFCDQASLQRQLARVERRLGEKAEPGENDHLKQLEVEIDEYFKGNRKVFEVSLVYPGTRFQQSVWQALLAIPYGETRTYRQLALQLSGALSARAVGSANGSNPIAIVIPCHRLINSQGGLSGYGGGLWRKQKLLELEGVLLS